MQLQLANGVLFQAVADEAVLLNLNDNHYYGLDDVGTRLWGLLVELGDVEAVIAQLLLEYDVDATTLRRDLAALIETMEERGLIRRVP